MSDLEHLDCEALLDLLKIKAGAARRLDQQLQEVKQREYDLQCDRDQVRQAVQAVLRELEAKAAL